MRRSAVLRDFPSTHSEHTETSGWRQGEGIFGGSGFTAPLDIPGEPVRTLRWTNRHPRFPPGLGVLLFRHSSEILDGARFRTLRDTHGAWIETDRPVRVRSALGPTPEETGIMEV